MPNFYIHYVNIAQKVLAVTHLKNRIHTHASNSKVSPHLSLFWFPDLILPVLPNTNSFGYGKTYVFIVVIHGFIQ